MKKFFVLALAAVVTVFMTGCPKAQKAANRLEAIKAAGKIVVYTNPEFPPYEYLGPNQEIVGSEIDIVKRIAEKIGVKAEIVSAEFDSIIGTVTTGKADLGASGFTINEERKKMVDFSDPFVRSVQYLTSVWTQVANTFRDYDEHLILESMNEPRLVGTNFEWYWTGSDKTCQEAADCINRLNQLFVDTVRATGGGNAARYLAVPAYDASPYYAANAAFQLPEDTADNRIIVSAHAYTPYDFALNLTSSDRTFDLEKDSQKKSEIGQFLNELYKRFVSEGIPVIMDEYGAMEKSGNLQDRVNFAAYYVASASARGITCCWWDNHVFQGTGERFGIFDRIKCEWVYPEIVQAIQANCLYQRGK